MIRSNFDYRAIRAKLEAFHKKVLEDTIKVLQILGEMCVNEARNNGAYKDQTGNLRSSIGYVIVANGKIVSSNFKKSGSGSIDVLYTNLKTKKVKSKKIRGGEDGISLGQSLAEALARKYSVGYALIVVAGMEYAAYVEANGLNVLTTAEMLAKSKWPSLRDKIFKNHNY